MPASISLPHDLMQAQAPYEVRFGDVWHAAKGLHVCDATEMLAVAIGEEGIVHKHGEANAVGAWATCARGIFGDITVISFPVTPETVALLNWSSVRSGSGIGFQERLELISALYGHDHAALHRPTA